MAKIDPEEACPCGSGRVFAECHQPLIVTVEPMVTEWSTLRVVPEPDPGTVPVFKRTDEGTIFFKGAETGLAQCCGKCGEPLIVGLAPSAVGRLIFQCNNCGSFNSTDLATQRHDTAGMNMGSTDKAIGQAYRDSVVRITELATTTDVLDGLSFYNCSIVGPAVLVILDGTNLCDCGFEGDLDAISWELPASKERIIGGIGLRSCTFEGCKFGRIGIAGNETVISQLRSALNPSKA
jgi:hypothetical protein